MYWPSTSCDGEYFFREIKGSFLIPDSILKLYENWQYSSSWPVSSRQRTLLKKLMKKQADPNRKEGLIGAFCRSYAIEEAIEAFLSDVYQPSVIPERYDYSPADSTAGVVIYDGKYAYSHHATDPACGHLCNAFDLVRLHRFGEMDDGADEKKQLPSVKAMLEFCTTDKKVKKQLAKEREEHIQEEFEKTDEDTNEMSQEDDMTWQLELELNKNGSVKDTPTNILTIIRHDPRLQGIAYNQMKYLIDIFRLLIP